MKNQTQSDIALSLLTEDKGFYLSNYDELESI